MVCLEIPHEKAIHQAIKCIEDACRLPFVSKLRCSVKLWDKTWFPVRIYLEQRSEKSVVARRRCMRSPLDNSIDSELD